MYYKQIEQCKLFLMIQACMLSVVASTLLGIVGLDHVQRIKAETMQVKIVPTSVGVEVITVKKKMFSDETFMERL